MKFDSLRQAAVLVCLTGFLSAAAAQSSEGVPAIKVEAPNGRISVLMGSIHVAHSQLRRPELSFFEGARRYVIEHDFRKPDSAEREVAGSARAPWARDLTTKELERFFERASCGGQSRVQAEEMLTFRSGQYANQVAYTVCEVSKFAFSRDQEFGLAAKFRGIRFDYLEDVDWIERQRHKVPSELAATSFKWILQRDPKQVLSEVALALNEGDYARILAAHRRSLGDENLADGFVEPMIYERNLAWMPALRTYLDEGGAVVLVGAAHLPGPRGLLALLAADGYKVSPMELPAIR